MKNFILILFLFFSLSASAQKDLVSLTESLVKNCRTDNEKVSAIFRWITSNISYTTFTKQQRRNAAVTEADDDDGPLKPLNERVADAVLKRRTAFCDGYARLFVAMCEKISVRAEIICGYANGGSGKATPKFGVNHYWNAVWLDDKWQLLDATWASGYIDLHTGEFVNNYDSRYYLTPPETFIRDHYPDDARWTLLPDDKVPDEFRRSPFRQRSFAKYGFTSFYPGRGIIDAAVGDTIVIKLEAGLQSADRVSPSTLTDSALFCYSPAWKFLHPDETDPAPLTKQYTFPVSSAGIKWLYLLYNDDVVLRYRLNISNR